MDRTVIMLIDITYNLSSKNQGILGEKALYRYPGSKRCAREYGGQRVCQPPPGPL